MTADREKLYEGKAKILYKGPDAGTLIQYFKDDATAFNAQKKAVLDGKGALNNLISAHLFPALGALGIPHHFIERISDREQLIKQVQIVPVEVIIRNVAAGSICSRLGLTEGAPLPKTLIEFCLKDDALGDPVIAAEHIDVLGLATPFEMDEIVEMSLRINDFLSGLFMAIGVKLIDFKLEFGRLETEDGVQIVLADEISPDNCRLWDSDTDEKMDKDRFRRDLGGLVEAYSEIARRLGLSLS
ncbi:MAG: phosphoribosylaminoimidazolesuccinocarboxamide synthase [Alphaproteobacteria bacterium]|jgi:phosphoribosylaminoimidazole-succinocarboxamide synthase|nr:phosphoribosylaminoimidazolesuccinocarboxamide synthase [Alphaproteobacteria bacterium]MBT5255949.1 phosphoribosylaminoimidazolesuccinocarboxamide synthase [Alphaproteobacteria bacterium]MBT5481470.1 phosphoribosylaminoimidazolesuccinocarboxamide synthase [Alphaproteobacteria bacterium]MBT5729622.1 phosphoribosylaminoimidazolesuccinocarboxamide synthase [Alphaproteobacteria bacterium]MBT7220338.1 phosphoribosylaminoimidazolesuccinocarboxamide synthase [Alphaproteobacteria bacterium]